MLVCSRACVCVYVNAANVNWITFLLWQRKRTNCWCRYVLVLWFSPRYFYVFHSSMFATRTYAHAAQSYVENIWSFFFLFFIFLHLRVIEMCVFASAILALTMRVPESFYASNVFFLYFRYQQKLSSGKNLSEECITVTIFLSQNWPSILAVTAKNIWNNHLFES